MTRAAWAWAAAAGVTLAAGVGCYHPPAPYAPGYGYPTYPTPAATPGAYPVAPGGSYVVPGGAVPGTLGPATTTPSGPTLAPQIDSGAPPSTYAPGGTPPGNSVPDYADPSADDYEPGNGFGTPPDDGFQPPATNNGSPFMREETAAPRRLNVEQAAAPMGGDYFAGLDDFQDAGRPAVPSNLAAAPSEVRPAGFEKRTRIEDYGFDPSAAPAEAASASDPAAGDGFDYDRAGYAWLRGVVDYDPARKNWHIIYGLTPDPADRFGGSLTLADDGRLADFVDNDVVLVQGRVDETAGRDALGKPLYRVTHAELLGRFE